MEAERPAASVWAAPCPEREWLKQQALAYLRWQLHARSKWYDNSPGVVWTAYLLVFLAWCIASLLNPHFTISLEQQSPTHPITGLLLAGLIPILLCMFGLAAYGSLLAARKDRLHDRLSFAITLNRLMEHARNGEEEGEIAPILTALLPHLTDDDAPEIAPRATALLLSMLRRKYVHDPAFALAALRALEHIGGETALPLVARIADHARHEQVAAAARQCLAGMQARLGQKQAEAVLLRPSEDGEGILLRPAVGAREPEAHLLLRSARE